MRENQVSDTAIKTACWRAYHAHIDNPKIFNDSLAYDLVGQSEYESFETMYVSIFKTLAPSEFASSFSDDAAILKLMMQSLAAPALVLSRARYAEDKLFDALRQGVGQYVILGAGMDTFAFRHSEVMEDLKVFEIDRIATQEFKRLRIHELGWEYPSHLRLIPADLSKDNISEALTRSSYNKEDLSFFNWLGVTCYLPRDVVFAVLQTISESAPAGSRIVFDYLDTDLLIPEKAAQRSQEILMMAEQAGERIITYFNPEALADDLAKVGFRLEENLNPSEINELYFKNRPDGYYACENAHLACAIVK
ncbi:MAG: class I SAM-dependent methyltransferase [Syntrophomonadaceae bacterium]